jgi:HlyD family secretion protein
MECREMKKKRLLLGAAAIALVSFLGYHLTLGKPGKSPAVIYVSGNIEVVDADVSFKIPGRVLERLVSEGDNVRAGQIVARLDSADLAQEVGLRKAEMEGASAALAELVAGSRPEEIAQADAATQGAQSRLDELTAGSRAQEVAAAEASVAAARADLEQAKAESDRQTRLYRKEVISSREYEVAQTAWETAKARLQETEERLKLIQEGPRKEQIDQARARLTEVKERLALVRKGPRRESIEQAQARLQQAREALALAQTRLGYATLTSPLSGLVLSENVEPGEYVSPGTPVVTVGGLDSVWVRAYINETDLGHVKVGQQVRVTTDTYPGKIYQGRISFLSSVAEFTPKNVQTAKERVKLVYRIKIDIANPNMELKPGMPADAEIALGANS